MKREVGPRRRNLHLFFYRRVFWLIYDIAVSEALSANTEGLVKMVWKLWILGACGRCLLLQGLQWRGDYISRVKHDNRDSLG